MGVEEAVGEHDRGIDALVAKLRGKTLAAGMPSNVMTGGTHGAGPVGEQNGISASTMTVVPPAIDPIDGETLTSLFASSTLNVVVSATDPSNMSVTV